MVCCRLEELHAARLKALSSESEDHRSQSAQVEKEMNYLRSELEAQKAANTRSPSNTMKNLVERLKAQLSQKEKQLKVSLFSFSFFFSSTRSKVVDPVVDPCESISVNFCGNEDTPSCFLACFP